jgi:hypothetical protein
MRLGKVNPEQGDSFAELMISVVLIVGFSPPFSK